MDPRVLCKNLKWLRRKKGFSQETLANIIFIARSAYSDYETGARVPDVQTLLSLSAVYGISLEVMISCDLTGHPAAHPSTSVDNSEMIKVLNDYAGLSKAARDLIYKRLQVLLEESGASGASEEDSHEDEI